MNYAAALKRAKSPPPPPKMKSTPAKASPALKRRVLAFFAAHRPEASRRNWYGPITPRSQIRTQPPPNARNTRTWPAQIRPTGFLSLPQRLRERILYESLPQETFRSLAEIALRRSQCLRGFQLSKNRYRRRCPSDFKKKYHYFIKRYCKRIAVHWIVFRDLILVRRMWLHVYNQYTTVYYRPWYDFSDNSIHGGYVEPTNVFRWSAERALQKLEREHGLAGTRKKKPGIKGWGRKKWVDLICQKIPDFPANAKALKKYPDDLRRARRYRLLHLPNLRFDNVRQLPEVLLWVPYHPPPKLKWHKNKEKSGFYNNFTRTSINARIDIFPNELIDISFGDLIPDAHLDRLAKINFHHRRTGNRFIAAFCKKFSKAHPSLVPSIRIVRDRWIHDIEDRERRYRTRHALRVAQYRNLRTRFHAKSQDVTDEDTQVFRDFVHEQMKPWKAQTSVLNLLALEDIYGIEELERSIVTDDLKYELEKHPERFVGLRSGKYRKLKKADDGNWQPGVRLVGRVEVIAPMRRGIRGDSVLILMIR